MRIWCLSAIRRARRFLERAKACKALSKRPPEKEIPRLPKSISRKLCRPAQHSPRAKAFLSLPSPGSRAGFPAAKQACSAGIRKAMHRPQGGLGAFLA